MTTIRFALATAALAALVAGGPTAAFAQNKTKCGPRATTEIETKSCNNGAVVQRACCTNPNKGKTHCKSFPKCPRVTPS